MFGALKKVDVDHDDFNVNKKLHKRLSFFPCKASSTS